MASKNYYKILNVNPKAEPQEIKKAYRRLAKEVHPDVSADKEQAEENFKEITEAYSVLSDPEKREQYDYFLKYNTKPPNSFYKVYREKRDDIFQPEFSAFFNNLFKKQRKKAAQKYMKGNDRKGKLTVSLEEIFHGSRRILNLGDEKIRINIQPGVEDKRVIKIREKGYKSKYGGRRGDLYVKIVTDEHPVYKRKRSNLYRNTRIDVFVALHGGSLSLETLHGTKTVNIPRLSAPGKQLTVKNAGLPIYGLDKEYGDLILNVKYALPEKLSRREKQLLAEILKIRENK